MSDNRQRETATRLTVTSVVGAIQHLQQHGLPASDADEAGQRRLQEAYYLIKEKKQKPSEVFRELGFERISHFSYSFKQFFGINPSEVHADS